MKILRVTASLMVVVLLGGRSAAGQSAQVHYEGRYMGQFTSRLAGGQLRVDRHGTVVGTGRVPDPTYDTTYIASVSELDLSTVTVSEESLPYGQTAGSFRIQCKGDQRCVSIESHSTGLASKNELGDSIDLFCETVAECQSFLSALRGGGSPAPRPVVVAPRVPPSLPQSERPVVTPPVVRAPEPSPREKEATALLEESQRLLKQQQDCLAAMSTYRAGPQREMPAGCLSDIDQMSVYRSSGSAAQPGVPRAEEIIDGSKIPSRIDFERLLVGPPPPPRPTGSDFNIKPEPLKPEPRVSEFPLPGSTIVRPPRDKEAAATSDDGKAPSLEIVPEPYVKPRWVEYAERIFGAPAEPGPIRQPGARDDTLPNHQADMDKATSGWNFTNPLKYPLEIQRVVNDKMNRIFEVHPPEDK